MNNRNSSSFFLLENPIQQYPWGSDHWIQELLSIPEKANNNPMAELWMGAHSKAPSLVIDGKGKKPLNAMIQENPAFYLGEKIVPYFTTLPFLFKLLAAASPLSIQAHPDKEQALEGFLKEEAAGIPPGAEYRNYKDPNHKPEIICALTPFTALCGFRERQVIIDLLAQLEIPTFGASLSVLARKEEAAAYRGFLQSLFQLSSEERQGLTQRAIQKLPILKINRPDLKKEWDLVEQFCSLYPGDPAVFSPLYLNVIELAPGEALFLPAGILHAYVHGFGFELMANSDNVLRGGLTQKHIDVEGLLRILRFEPFKPDILRGVSISPCTKVYPSPVKEFSLFRMDLDGSGIEEIPEGTPEILIILEGSFSLTDGDQKIHIGKGQSVFLPATRNTVTVEGRGIIFGASTGNTFL